MNERDIEPLPPDLAQLLDAERRRPEAVPSPQRRVASRLGATLGLPGLAGPGGSGIADGGGGGSVGGAPTGGGPGPTLGPAAGAVAAGSAVSVLSGKSLTVAIIGLSLAAGTTVGLLLPNGSADRSNVPTSTAAPLSEAASPNDPSASPRALEAPLEPPSAVPAVPAAPSPVADTPAQARAPITGGAAPAASEANGPGHDAVLAAERALLESARAALVRGQTEVALAALDRHAREFPRGRLGEEREGIWIQTLLAAGRRDEARERAVRFKASYPRSMLLPAFEQSLGPLGG